MRREHLVKALRLRWKRRRQYLGQVGKYLERFQKFYMRELH